MKTREALYLLAGAFLAVVPARAFSALHVEQPAHAQESVENMLQDFVADFRADTSASQPFTFGIRVTGAERPDWHVYVGGQGGAG